MLRARLSRIFPKISDAMKVAVVAAEMTPYAKAGGLADVIGALPVELEGCGARVCVVIPGYKTALESLAHRGGWRRIQCDGRGWTASASASARDRRGRRADFLHHA